MYKYNNTAKHNKKNKCSEAKKNIYNIIEIKRYCPTQVVNNVILHRLTKNL